jgi:hypothetical protein
MKWSQVARSCTLALLLSRAGRSAAQADAQDDANVRCVVALSDDQVETQLALLERSFTVQRFEASMWVSGWGAFNLFNIGLGIERYVHADTQLARDNWLVSMIGGGLFVTEVALLPMPGMYAHRRFARISADTPAERRSKLMRGLTLLDKAAHVEETNSNLTAHLAGLAFAILSTGYVWLRNPHADRLPLALGLQFGTSVVFAELTLWTVPHRARRDRHALRSACGYHKHMSAVQSISVGLSAGQVAVQGRF